MTLGFKDHFPTRPDDYARYRPTYPDELCLVSNKCDAIIDRLYRGIVGEFWPPERVTIEQGYKGVQLPGKLAAANQGLSSEYAARIGK